MMRIAHVITGLGTGGAETMLLRLIEQMRGSEITNTVVSLTDRGTLAPHLEAVGAPVIATGLSRSFVRVPFAVMSIRRTLVALKPDLVQTWMYHADLIGGLAARLAGIRPLLWNVRQSNVGHHLNRASTLLTMWSCARLSTTLPVKIVCNSRAALRTHRDLGYEPSKFVVVPNGFDVERFRPDSQMKVRVRDELRVEPGTIILGYVARWDRQKNPEGLVLAASRVMDVRPDVSVVLCGHGLSRDNPELMEWIRRTGHESRFHLLGRRDDVARITAAFDVGVSSSVGEGFSNAIGEAMACGVPCVVTDVGDSAAIVGDAGIVVPPGSAAGLAEGLLSLVSSGELRARLGGLARRRVESEFGIAAVARRYVEVWKEVLACAA